MLLGNVNKQYDIAADVSVVNGLLEDTYCCIKYIQYTNSSSSMPLVIWVQFKDADIGKQHRQQYKFLHVQHKRINFGQPYLKGKFLGKNRLITGIQFPLQCAAARTTHVWQHATLNSHC